MEDVDTIKSSPKFRLPAGAPPSAGKLQILDLWGRAVRSQTLVRGLQEHTLSIAELPSGVYFVKVLKDGIHIWSEKVIKQ